MYATNFYCRNQPGQVAWQRQESTTDAKARTINSYYMYSTVTELMHNSWSFASS